MKGALEANVWKAWLPGMLDLRPLPRGYNINGGKVVQITEDGVAAVQTAGGNWEIGNLDKAIRQFTSSFYAEPSMLAKEG